MSAADRPIRRPLVGFDGSQAACAALSRAAELVRANHGCLRVALVIARQPCCAWPMAGVTETPEQYTAGQLQMLREAIDKLEPDISVVSVACRGATGPALVNAARDGGCDAIVIGARRGLWTRFTGGVAHYLGRHAEVPLIVVAGDESEAPRGSAGAERLPGAVRVRTA
jgi:nucleotide-binding universal stress UspA family protein